MVKRVLKIIGIIMLVVLVLIVVLFIIAALKPAVPDDYTDTVKTGGNIEKKYLNNGTYAVAYTEVKVDEDFEKYEIYYPDDLPSGNRKYPVIVVSNGTGIKASKCKAMFEHFASWGFIVIGNDEAYTIPYNSIPDEFAVGLIRVAYKKTLSEDEINRIIDVANDVFASDLKHLDTPEPYEPVDIHLGKMMFVISALVIVIVLLAISKLYSFIFTSRKKTLTYMRLCGCTRVKTCIIYSFEVMITMFFTTIAGFAIFKCVLLDLIVALYPSFAEFFITQVYITIIVVYMFVAMMFMGMSIISLTPRVIVCHNN